MKVPTYSQKGIAHLAVILVIVLVAVVGYVGYTVYQQNQTKEAAVENSQEASVPEKIDSKSDLEQTNKALETSGSELDSGFDDSALDDDLNDML